MNREKMTKKSSPENQEGYLEKTLKSKFESKSESLKVDKDMTLEAKLVM